MLFHFNGVFTSCSVKSSKFTWDKEFPFASHRGAIYISLKLVLKNNQFVEQFIDVVNSAAQPKGFLVYCESLNKIIQISLLFTPKIILSLFGQYKNIIYVAFHFHYAILQNIRIVLFFACSGISILNLLASPRLLTYNRLTTSVALIMECHLSCANSSSHKTGPKICRYNGGRLSLSLARYDTYRSALRLMVYRLCIL